MPSIGLFKKGTRPSGGEFACCNRCNNGTRGADAVAQFIAKNEVDGSPAWKFESNLKLISIMRTYAPGVLEELYSDDRGTIELVNVNGLIRQVRTSSMNGYNTKRNLDLFSAKVALATYNAILGRPLRPEGLQFQEWSTRTSMAPVRYESLCNMLPNRAELQQGKKISGEQYSLRYQYDKNGFLAACVSFHYALFVTIIAADDKDILSHLNKINSQSRELNKARSGMKPAGLPWLRI